MYTFFYTLRLLDPRQIPINLHSLLLCRAIVQFSIFYYKRYIFIVPVSPIQNSVVKLHISLFSNTPSCFFSDIPIFPLLIVFYNSVSYPLPQKSSKILLSFCFHYIRYSISSQYFFVRIREFLIYSQHFQY